MVVAETNKSLRIAGLDTGSPLLLSRMLFL